MPDLWLLRMTWSQWVTSGSLVSLMALGQWTRKEWERHRAFDTNLRKASAQYRSTWMLTYHQKRIERGPISLNCFCSDFHSLGLVRVTDFLGEFGFLRYSGRGFRKVWQNFEISITGWLKSFQIPSKLDQFVIQISVWFFWKTSVFLKS